MQNATNKADGGLRVYLVEDSEIVRTRLEERLAAIAGVRTVGSAAGALEAIRGILASRPDVVLLDLSLAQGSGFDVLSGTRDLLPASDIYVLSSFAGGPYRKLALSLGASDCFDKTKDFERVCDLVAQRAAHRSTEGSSPCQPSSH
jgi:two-component system response regulator DevR